MVDERFLCHAGGLSMPASWAIEDRMDNGSNTMTGSNASSGAAFLHVLPGLLLNLIGDCRAH